MLEDVISFVAEEVGYAAKIPRVVYNESKAIMGQVSSPILDVVKSHKYQRKGRPTVAIFPGFWEPQFATRALADELQRYNLRTRRWNHNSSISIAKNVAIIAEKLEKKYELEGRKLYGVGRSMGGLVLRHLLYLKPHLFEKAVILGAPNEGTYAAKILSPFFPSCKDMVPSSEYISWLNSMGVPEHIPVINFYSTHDHLIWGAVRGKLRGEGNVTNVKVSNVGHISIAEKPMFAMILEALLGEGFSRYEIK